MLCWYHHLLLSSSRLLLLLILLYLHYSLPRFSFCMLMKEGGCCAKGTDDDEHRALDSLSVTGNVNNILCILVRIFLFTSLIHKGTQRGGENEYPKYVNGVVSSYHRRCLPFGMPISEEIDRIRPRIGVCLQDGKYSNELIIKNIYLYALRYFVARVIGGGTYSHVL